MASRIERRSARAAARYARSALRVGSADWVAGTRRGPLVGRQRWAAGIVARLVVGGGSASLLLRTHSLRSPDDCCARPVPVRGGGQRPVDRVPVPGRRHRHQHPVQERHDLAADDLRPAGLPAAGPAGAAGRALAVAGLVHPAGRGRRRRAGGAAAPAVRQDAHPARRGAAGPAGDLPGRRPRPPGHVRLALPPGREHRPGRGTPAAGPAGAGPRRGCGGRHVPGCASRCSPGSTGTRRRRRRWTRSGACCGM